MESEKAKLHRQARQREYYRQHKEKRDQGLGYYQQYYQRNKKKLTEYAQKWRDAHPDKVKEYQRRYRDKVKALGLSVKKEVPRSQPDIDKAKALFRDPSKAAHLQWLVEHSKNKINQYEPC